MAGAWSATGSPCRVQQPNQRQHRQQLVNLKAGDMRTAYSQFVWEHLQGTAGLLCSQFCKSVLQPQKPPHDQVSEPGSVMPSLALRIVTSIWADVPCALRVRQMRNSCIPASLLQHLSSACY